MLSTDPAATAKRALPCLDLTNLNDDCTPADIEALCRRAQTPHGPVAAVCIWPRFASQAKPLLEGSAVRIATVVNFPHGGEDVRPVLREARQAVAEGADEIDTVLPWRLLDRQPQEAERQVRAVCEAVAEAATVKVILETGELKDQALIRRASQIAMDAGADFIKTSTGKVPVNATPDAARTMLSAIAENGGAVGFKAAGGIRTVEDAALYLGLADEALGPDWASPHSFRFGASGLLDALLGALEGRTVEANSRY